MPSFTLSVHRITVSNEDGPDENGSTYTHLFCLKAQKVLALPPGPAWRHRLEA